MKFNPNPSERALGARLKSKKFRERFRKVRLEQGEKLCISEIGPEREFSARSTEIRTELHWVLDIEVIEPERFELFRERDSRLVRESRSDETDEKSVLSWIESRFIDETLEFVQETPVKLQGESFWSQSGSAFGLGSEDLKLKSCWESLEREAEEEGFRERKRRRERRERNLRVFELL